MHILHSLFSVIFIALFLLLTIFVQLIFFESNPYADDQTSRKSGVPNCIILVYIAGKVILHTVFTDYYQYYMIMYQFFGTIICFYNMSYNNKNPFYNEISSRAWSLFTTILVWSSFTQAFSKILQY